VRTHEIPGKIIVRHYPKEMRIVMGQLQKGTSVHKDVTDPNLLKWWFDYAVAIPHGKLHASLHAQIGRWWTWVPMHKVPKVVKDHWTRACKAGKK
jgi:hypothetical protein